MALALVLLVMAASVASCRSCGLTEQSSGMANRLMAGFADSASRTNAGTIRGEFLLTAATGIAPSLEARRAAVTLADQVAVAICNIQAEPPFDVNADAALPTRCARHQRALAATVESAKRAGRTACTRPETARSLAGS